MAVSCFLRAQSRGLQWINEAATKDTEGWMWILAPGKSLGLAVVSIKPRAACYV